MSAEDVVEGADRIADPLGDLAGGEAREADLRQLPVPFEEDHFLELGAAMIRSSAHGTRLPIKLNTVHYFN